MDATRGAAIHILDLWKERRPASKRTNPEYNFIPCQQTNRPFVSPTSQSKTALAMLARLAVLFLCSWYVSLHINLSDLAEATAKWDPKWALLSVLFVMLQIPLVGLRWANILHSIHFVALPRAPLIAITAIATFFGQVTPTVVGDGIRLWLLARLGPTWQVGLSSLVIDRAVGTLALLALGLSALLMPSPLADLQGHRPLMMAIFAGVLATALVGILFSKRIGSVLANWPLTAWLATIARAMHEGLLVSPRRGAIVAIAGITHLTTILALWSLAHAEGLDLTFADAAVLFTVIVGGSLIAISIAGWGVREVLVLTLLQGHGIPPHHAVWFSISFGLCTLAASLPGLLVWLFYWPAAPHQSPARQPV